MLYFLNELLTKHGHDADITQLLDTRTATSLRLNRRRESPADRLRHIRSSTRRYPSDEERVEGLTAEDNGRRRPDPVARGRSARQLEEVRAGPT